MTKKANLFCKIQDRMLQVVISTKIKRRMKMKIKIRVRITINDGECISLCDK